MGSLSDNPTRSPLGAFYRSPLGVLQSVPTGVIIMCWGLGIPYPYGGVMYQDPANLALYDTHVANLVAAEEGNYSPSLISPDYSIWDLDFCKPDERSFPGSLGTVEPVTYVPSLASWQSYYNAQANSVGWTVDSVYVCVDIADSAYIAGVPAFGHLLEVTNDYSNFITWLETQVDTVNSPSDLTQSVESPEKFSATWPVAITGALNEYNA